MTPVRDFPVERHLIFSVVPVSEVAIHLIAFNDRQQIKNIRFQHFGDYFSDSLLIVDILQFRFKLSLSFCFIFGA